MPRRSSNKSSSPVPRRQSARIAAASANKSPSDSPAKRTRRSTKRDSASKSDAPAENVDHNGNESIPKENPVVEEPPEKKAKIEEVNATSEKEFEVNQEQMSKTKAADYDGETSKTELDAAKDAGFEIVDKSRSPLPDSEDVKKAIDAQAVVPEINASTSGDKQPANGSETKEASTDDDPIVEKHSTEDSESIKEGVTGEEISH